MKLNVTVTEWIESIRLIVERDWHITCIQITKERKEKRVVILVVLVVLVVTVIVIVVVLVLVVKCVIKIKLYRITNIFFFILTNTH